VVQEHVGGKITSSFDATGNLRRRVTTLDVDREAIEEFGYLSHGFLAEQRVRHVETGGTLTDLITRFERDSMNRIQSVTFPGGETRRFHYDDMGRMDREEVPGSHTNLIGFDAVGNTTRIERASASERFVYDGHDRLTQVIGANGTQTEFERDPNGNLTLQRVHDAGNTLLSEVRFEYDSLNRLRRKILQRDTGESVLKTDYNSGERSVTITDALGVMVRTFLDEDGRPQRVEGPNGVVELARDLNSNLIQRKSTDAGGTFTTGYGYNPRNQVIASTNALGDVSRRLLGYDGRAYQQIDRERHSITNEFTLLGEVSAEFKPNGIQNFHDFDAARNLAEFRDIAGHPTRYAHDAQNRMVTNTLPNGAQTVFREFNAFGTPTRIEMPRGVEVTVQTDFEGKITNRIVSRTGPVRSESFAYDGLRRLKLITDPSGSMGFDYDRSGYIRQIQRRYVFQSNPPAPEPLEFTVRQETDAGLFRSTLEYPVDGMKLTHRRDPSGRLSSLEPERGEPVIQSTLWLGDGRYGTRTFGNGRIQLALHYDGLPRVVGRQYTRIQDGAVLVDVRQAHDRNGAVLARQYGHRGYRTDLYSYDSGYRLTTTYPGARPQYVGETAAPLPVPAGLSRCLAVGRCPPHHGIRSDRCAAFDSHRDSSRPHGPSARGCPDRATTHSSRRCPSMVSLARRTPSETSPRHASLFGYPGNPRPSSSRPNSTTTTSDNWSGSNALTE
jgi:YD repeat-containing protein